MKETVTLYEESQNLFVQHPVVITDELQLVKNY